MDISSGIWKCRRCCASCILCSAFFFLLFTEMVVRAAKRHVGRQVALHAQLMLDDKLRRRRRELVMWRYVWEDHLLACASSLPSRLSSTVECLHIIESDHQCGQECHQPQISSLPVIPKHASAFIASFLSHEEKTTNSDHRNSKHLTEQSHFNPRKGTKKIYYS